jgi:hypothetical protein
MAAAGERYRERADSPLAEERREALEDGELVLRERIRFGPDTNGWLGTRNGIDWRVSDWVLENRYELLRDEGEDTKP